MSIGEGEDYRYYWQSSYNTNPPEWLSGPNPDWPGNYKVKYWLDSWKAIIYGNNEAYLDKLLEAGFDSTYLDIIDGYEYFEGLFWPLIREGNVLGRYFVPQSSKLNTNGRCSALRSITVCLYNNLPLSISSAYYGTLHTPCSI